MNYKLAVKLKESGFPQKHDYMDREEYRALCKKCGNSSDGATCVPNLSELIEECQKVQVFKMWFLKDGKAGVQPESGTPDDTVFYPTPEEAVANLWLNLNKDSRTKDKTIV